MVSTNTHSSAQEGQARAPNYKCLECTVVLLCGYQEQQLAELRQLVLGLGGKVQLKPACAATAHVVVADNVLSHQYREARSLCTQIPSVHSGWLRACQQAGAQVSQEPYLLKPLTGCVVSTTNFEPNMRLTIQPYIMQHGGTYSAQLVKDQCTHLVCARAGGSKYSAAVFDWGMRNVVSYAWLEASVQQGWPVDEAKYYVSTTGAVPAPPSMLAQTRATVVAPPQPIAPAAMLGPGQQQQQQQLNSSRAYGATVPGAAASAGFSSSPPKRRSTRTSSGVSTAGQQQQAQHAGVHHLQGAGPPVQAAAAAAPSAAAAVEQVACPTGLQDAPQAPPAAGVATVLDSSCTGASRSNSAWEDVPGAVQAIPVVPLGDLECEPQQPLLLESVVLWWCGILPGSSEAQEMWALMAQYSGTVYPDLCSAVTHIMVGPLADITELQAVRDHLSTTTHLVHLVKPDWLRLCHHQQQLLPLPDPRCSLSLELLQQRSRRAAAVAAGGAGLLPVALPAGGSSQQHRAVTRPAGPAAKVFAPAVAHNTLGAAAASAREQAAADAAAAAAMAAAEQDTAPQYWAQQPADPSRVFEDCWFTLAASGGAQDASLVEIIIQAGGKVFSSPEQVPRGALMFAVCPHSLPLARCHLLAPLPCWHMVHPTCRVTRAWVLACRQAGGLQRITTRSPLWAPLPYELPLPSFSSLVITCSSFESGKRDTIGRLVVLLGAKYEDCLKRGATHLIVPQLGSVEGEPGYGSDSLIKKCQRAVAWKMCLVTPSWLVECAAGGQRLDEAEFYPLGELPAAATQGAALPSQLPVTQATKLRSTQVPGASQVSRLRANSSIQQQLVQGRAYADGARSSNPGQLMPPPASVRPAAAVAAPAAEAAPPTGAAAPQQQLWPSGDQEQVVDTNCSEVVLGGRGKQQPLEELSNQLLGAPPHPDSSRQKATPEQAAAAPEMAIEQAPVQPEGPCPSAAAAAAAAFHDARGSSSLPQRMSGGAAAESRQQGSAGPAGTLQGNGHAPGPAALAHCSSDGAVAEAVDAEQDNLLLTGLDALLERATGQSSKLGSQQLLPELPPAASSNPMSAALKQIQRQALAQLQQQQAAAGAGAGGGVGVGVLQSAAAGRPNSAGEPAAGSGRGSKRARLTGEDGLPPTGLLQGSAGSGGGSAGAGLRGSGGGRYGTRGAAAAEALVDDAFLDQPSQQVGYEMGQQPAERLRARQAATRSRRGVK